MKHLCIVAALVTAFALVSSVALAQTFEPYTFEVEVTQTVEAERGEIMVPENRSDPDSRMIPIRFVRLESRAENSGGRSCLRRKLRQSARLAVRRYDLPHERYRRGDRKRRLSSSCARELPVV